MSNWIAAQLVACSILVLEGFLFAYIYRRRIVRPARLKAAQYRFFALRDKAIRIAIDTPDVRNDELWQLNYRMLNEIAKEATVDRLMQISVPKFIRSFEGSGVSIKFQTGGEGAELPTDAAMQPIKADDLPPMPSLVLGTILALLETCYRMTRWLRIKYWLASQIGAIRNLLVRRAGNYARWQNLLSIIAPQVVRAKMASGDFGRVVEREATRQSNRPIGQATSCGLA